MELDAKIGKRAYVSFDVFDTLIKRSVAKPTDLFQIVERQYRLKNPDFQLDFCQKRIEAEKRITEATEEPVDLSAIYSELRRDLGNHTDTLMKMEIQAEIDGCHPNPKYIELFQRCIRNGKTIVLISDMYLTSDTIIIMLEKCGVKGYKQLYISCEMGLRKRDGTLYKRVLEDLDIHPNQIIHFGDNVISDVIRPMSMGIHAVKVGNDQRELCDTPSVLTGEDEFDYRTIMACIRNSSYGEDEYAAYGCKIFGPLLYGFVCWLKEQLVADGIHNVYFMSRDGYMMKKAFDELKVEGITTHYMYCSRRSFVVPTLWRDTSFQRVTSSFSHLKVMTMRRFLLRIGLDPERYKEEIRHFDLDLDHIYTGGSFYSVDKVIKFYNTIRGDVEANSKKEYEAFKVYIDSLDLCDRIAVVDIGYHGTMQKVMTELFKSENRDIDIRGYYVGVAQDVKYAAKKALKMKGYIFDCDVGNEYYQEIQKFISLFEAQFLAPHGSVKKFVLDDNKPVPEFEEYEYKSDSGKIVDETAIIADYQEGAIKFIHCMKTAYNENVLRNDPRVVLLNFTQIANNPTYKETKLFGDLRFDNYEISYFARPKSLLKYIFNAQLLKRDYVNSTWKAGFLLRLLRIPGPYGKVLDFGRKIKRAMHK